MATVFATVKGFVLLIGVISTDSFASRGGQRWLLADKEHRSHIISTLLCRVSRSRWDEHTKLARVPTSGLS